LNGVEKRKGVLFSKFGSVVTFVAKEKAWQEVMNESLHPSWNCEVWKHLECVGTSLLVNITEMVQYCADLNTNLDSNTLIYSNNLFKKAM